MDASNFNIWLQCEQVGYGMGSFGIMTLFSGKKEKDGYYYYDIFLLNHSYYRNGNPASSYIKNINVYTFENGQWYNVINFSYVLVNPPSDTFDGYFHLTYIFKSEKIPQIQVTWGSVDIY